MQTSFTLAQLADPDVARSEQILRKCVHCGFCTATCPTYVLLGDERDSPRGRIYLIKDMLEGGRPATREVARHIDRCLSCLACMTTCLSGVHYMHLVDHARAHIEETWQRPLPDRLLRRLLGVLMPRPKLLRLALLFGWLAKPLSNVLPSSSPDAGGATFLRRLRAFLDAVPVRLAAPSPVDRPQVFPAAGPRRMRVALLPGCGQQVLAPQVNEATIRLLTRHGVEVVHAAGSGCCGSAVLHIGARGDALALARRNIAAWISEADRHGLDAIVVNASGCGTTLKDYGHMLADDPQWRDRAARIAALAKDVTEVMVDLAPKPQRPPVHHDGKPVRVAWHSACSAQHGQKLIEPPKSLLRAMGFEVREPAESHLCCGWAGTYQVLQPVLSEKLRARKLGDLERLGTDLIAAGNFGCIGHLSMGSQLPVVHVVELLDWATGGPGPAALTLASGSKLAD